MSKKCGGQRPFINLKKLNQFISYDHFKFEGLYLWKESLEEGDYLCKLDFFCVLLNKVFQKFARFEWKGTLLEFLEDVTMDSETVIFLLQSLDSVINIKKSILQPTKSLEF